MIDRSRKQMWVGFAIAPGGVHSYFPDGYPAEEEVLQHVQKRHPGLPAFTLDINDRNTGYRTVLRRLADIGILGIEAEELIPVILGALEKAAMKFLDRTGDGDCSRLLNAILSLPEANLTGRPFPDLAGLGDHLKACPRCQSAVQNILDRIVEDGVTPRVQGSVQGLIQQLRSEG